MIINSHGEIFNKEKQLVIRHLHQLIIVLILDSSKQSRREINLSDLSTNPGLRIRILDYNPNIGDEVHRAYLLKGPCQPQSHDLPYAVFGHRSRRLNYAWFDEFSTWLEYSIKKNAAYCFCCYQKKCSLL